MEVQREVMDVDILIVGGGSAGLATAIHIHDQVKNHNKLISDGKTSGNPISDPMIVVLEKGPEIGAHSFSGAVMNPIGIEKLIPNYRELGCPVEGDVSDEAVYYLAKNWHLKLPVIPPPLRNHGNMVISLSQFNRWLGKQAEERGINIFPGFAAVDALYEGNRVVGVRTGDKGRNKVGDPKPNFELGMDLRAKVTVFSEGPRGSLFRKVADRLRLREGKQPDTYSEGVKEIIQMPKGRVKPGSIIHTMGYPLSEAMGGTFIYGLSGDRYVVGIVGYLSTHDPLFDPHRELQKFKTHPFIRRLLEGGEVIAYGGKVIPAGGWNSMPRLHHDGMVVVGDSAGMVDDQKLKGIHHGILAGMMAADTIVEALKEDDFSSRVLKRYEDRVLDSSVAIELKKVRNFHHALSKGLAVGGPVIALQEITNGRGLEDNPAIDRDSQTTDDVIDVWGPEKLEHPDNQLPRPDGKMFFDKLSSVYLTKTMHDEDSPNHLKIQNGDTCKNVCVEKFNSPCNHFCPANVYEMVDDEEEPGKKRLQVNFTNCIHCKTCDIKCPFDNILWTPPEGGGGPQYSLT